MATTNPYTELRTALQTTCLAMDGVAFAEPYAGQDVEAMLQRMGLRGLPGVYCRVLAGTKDKESYGDAAVTLVHIVVCAGSQKARGTAQQTAEQLLWELYDSLADHRLGLGWLDCGLQFRDWQVRGQTETGCVLSLIMATRFQMDEWTE